jgi:hypothetical protein
MFSIFRVDKKVIFKPVAALESSSSNPSIRHSIAVASCPTMARLLPSG